MLCTIANEQSNPRDEVVAPRGIREKDIWCDFVMPALRPSSMEPLLPSDPKHELADLAIDLLRQSAALGVQLREPTRSSVAEILRPMNSYYSNFIEGHSTHPIEIERALRADHGGDAKKRELQQEGLAHIEVQRLLEERLTKEPGLAICSPSFLCWIHREFYQRMPAELRRVRGPNGKEHLVVPGELRDVEVQIGRHVPSDRGSLDRFLTRFAEIYEPSRLGKVERVLAAAASHHRLAWIHPFVDGNGRVTRLFTHAYLVRAEIDGHGLWTASRGLARAKDSYFSALAVADEERRSDYDGRGALSEQGLSEFCAFFLRTALDQISFMSSLLELDSFESRIEGFADLLTFRAGVPPSARDLLRDVLLRGAVARGEVARITGLSERSARSLLSSLTGLGLLVSDTPKGPVRLGFPLPSVGYYFPRLYPEGVEQSLIAESYVSSGPIRRGAKRPVRRPRRRR
jgi:Fic family protein